jgi:5,10-methylenetetrahydromethanopterin reductase
MRISRYLFPHGSLQDYVADIAATERAGFDAVWIPQIFGWDALTVLALASASTSRLRLGTAVVSTYPTHPLALAANAMTTQAASAGRLTLGIGASHRFLVEGVWGMSFDAPASRMRSYLDALVPAMAGGNVDVHDDHVTARLARPLEFDDAPPPPVLIAAMGNRMLDLAGTHADGTVTWLTGTKTLAMHIIPRISAAAQRGSRRPPTVVAGLPVCVTDDPAHARATAHELLSPYAAVPSYRAVLDLEDAAAPADVAIIGNEEHVSDRLQDLADIGVTEFSAWTFGTAVDQQRTAELLLRHPGR